MNEEQVITWDSQSKANNSGRYHNPAATTSEASLAVCCTCRFLRHFVPQKPRFMGCFGSLQGKNRLFGDFLMLIARSATNS
jgi:hypothetical protein